MSGLEPQAGPSRTSSLHAESSHDPADKGKRRLSHGRGPLLGDSDDDSIAGDERTPLLPTSAAGQSSKRKRRWPSFKRVLCILVTCIVLVAIALLVTLHVLLGHLYHRRLSDPERNQRYGERALVIEGPDRVDLPQMIDEHNLRMAVSFRAGVDVAKAFEDEPALDWVERRLIKAGLMIAPRAYVNFPADIVVESGDGLQLALLPHVQLPSVQVPLRWRPEGDWLQPINYPFDVVLPSGDNIAAFVNASWAAKRAEVRVSCREAEVLVGWNWKKGVSRSLAVARQLALDIPAVPGLSDLSKLVNLKQYAISPIVNHQLGLNALAVATNPLANVTLPPMIERLLETLGEEQTIRMPWRLPFNVSIQGTKHNEISMARVAIMPFELINGFRQEQVNLSLSGVFATQSNASNEALSTFMARFLLGLDNPVVVRYAPLPEAHHQSPPPLLTPLLDPYAVHLKFPGAADNERKLLEDVTIENMHISLGNGNSDLRASGKVVGKLKLPKEFSGIVEAEALAINAVAPDVYVYDGVPPPARDKGSVPGDGRPPASNAFARLQSDGFLPATTQRSTDEKNRTVTLVHAELKDAPLDLLPGRGDVFRRFMAKILFGSGDGPDGRVKTGVKGVVAIQATIEGFGVVDLAGLPVEGEFYVGKDDAGRFALADYLRL